MDIKLSVTEAATQLKKFLNDHVLSGMVEDLIIEDSKLDESTPNKIKKGDVDDLKIVLRHFSEGRLLKIDAIRDMRQVNFSMGLAEAKDRVEMIEALYLPK